MQKFVLNIFSDENEKVHVKNEKLKLAMWELGIRTVYVNLYEIKEINIFKVRFPLLILKFRNTTNSLFQIIYSIYKNYNYFYIILLRCTGTK